MKKVPLSIKFMCVAYGVKALMEIGVQAYNILAQLEQNKENEQAMKEYMAEVNKKQPIGFNVDAYGEDDGVEIISVEEEWDDDEEWEDEEDWEDE